TRGIGQFEAADAAEYRLRHGQTAAAHLVGDERASRIGRPHRAWDKGGSIETEPDRPRYRGEHLDIEGAGNRGRARSIGGQHQIEWAYIADQFIKRQEGTGYRCHLSAP